MPKLIVSNLVRSKTINFLIDFVSALHGSGIFSSATRLRKGLLEYGYHVDINSHQASAIVHAHTALPISFVLVRRIRKLRKKKNSSFPILIAHGHTTIEDFVNSFAFTNHIKFFLRFYLPSYYKSFDHIIAVSEYNKRILMNYGIPENKLSVISNGIKIKDNYSNETIRTKAREYLGLKESDKLVICVGVCIYRKGVDKFIDIASLLPQYNFIWIGKRVLNAHASYLKGKFKLAKQLPNCKLPGYVSYKTLIGLLNAADLFLYPTREENQGISFLEAILYNKPCVISSHPVFDEFIDNKHVLKAKSINEYVQKVQMVFNDDQLAKRLVSCSKEYLEVHNINHSIKKVADLYSKLILEKA